MLFKKNEDAYIIIFPLSYQVGRSFRFQNQSLQLQKSVNNNLFSVYRYKRVPCSVPENLSTFNQLKNRKANEIKKRMINKRDATREFMCFNKSHIVYTK
jgi:hypothetical protein